MSRADTKESKYETETYRELMRLAKDHPESCIHAIDCNVYTRQKDLISEPSGLFKSFCASSKPWFTEMVEGYEILDANSLPAGHDGGARFKSVCINTALYLPYLVSQCLKHKVVFKRAALAHIKEAPSLHTSGTADVILNCSGLAAAKLGGVEDKNMVPIRGQTVLVRNSVSAMHLTSGTDDSSDEVVYIMTRAAGGGTILGGSYQMGNYSSEIDHDLAGRIMRRCLEVCPQLGKLDIISHNVGFRPYRINGPRLEKDKIDGIKVVHNYGAAGYGYQASYGMANEAVRLVEDSLGIKAKL